MSKKKEFFEGDSFVASLPYYSSEHDGEECIMNLRNELRKRGASNFQKKTEEKASQVRSTLPKVL